MPATDVGTRAGTDTDIEIAGDIITGGLPQCHVGAAAHGATGSIADRRIPVAGYGDCRIRPQSRIARTGN